MKQLAFFLLLFAFQQAYSEGNVVIRSAVNPDRSVTLSYTKHVPGSYCVYVNFDRLENANHPQRKFIARFHDGNLVTLKPLDREKPIYYSYKCRITKGIPDPKVDSTFVYLLPFTNQTETKAIFMGNVQEKYFHQDKPENWKSFLFTASAADTICAARKGTVITVLREHEADTLVYYSFSSDRNRIEIEHEDGTIATYTGFDKDKILVEPGDEVFANQPLGMLAPYDKSGNHQLRFSVHFRSDKTASDLMVCQPCPYVYIDPNFQTSEGIVRLKDRTPYVARVTEDIVVQEMSKKEQKNRLKKKHQAL